MKKTVPLIAYVTLLCIFATPELHSTNGVSKTTPSNLSNKKHEIVPYVPSLDRVNEHQGNIAKQLWFDTQVERFFLAAGTFSTVALLYYMAQKSDTPVPNLSNAASLVPSTIPHMVHNEPPLSWKTWASGLPKAVGSVLFSQRTLYNLLNVAEHLCVAHLFQTIYTATHHPHTIAWYTYQKIHLPTTIATTKLLLQAYEHGTIPSDELELTHYELLIHCDGIIQKSEQLTAFMYYKASIMPPSTQKQMTYLAHALFCRTKEYAEATAPLYTAIDNTTASSFLQILTTFEHTMLRIMATVVLLDPDKK